MYVMNWEYLMTGKGNYTNIDSSREEFWDMVGKADRNFTESDFVRVVKHCPPVFLNVKNCFSATINYQRECKLFWFERTVALPYVPYSRELSEKRTRTKSIKSACTGYLILGYSWPYCM